MSEPSLNVRLYGTEEIAAPPRILKAGRLSAELDAGNLRYIRYDGAEIMRAVSFIVRDRNWGTYNPDIADLAVDEMDEGFRVTYRASVGDGTQTLRYRATITGTQTSLSFHGVGVAETDFFTNRTGFVVLHPLDGVAGRPVTMKHVDGRIVEGRFPEIIDPVQPMTDLRELTHEPLPGLRVICRMEGDTFEMEDQRNWTDASYKTYVRPLTLPWPYQIVEGEGVDQTVSLTVQGVPAASATVGSGDTLTIGGDRGTLPRIGTGLHPSELDACEREAGSLAELELDVVVCHFDPRDGEPAEIIAGSAAFAHAIGAEPWLEAVVVSVERFEDEVKGLGRAAAEGTFPVVLVSPASDLKCTLPGSVWPPAPDAGALHRAARSAFPGAAIGGGMFSYFTELNRKRPPLDSINMVGFTTSAIVHAGDDRSVMEGLGSLPFIAKSVHTLIGEKPWFVGPSAIGMRMNPYGAAPMENPGNIRQAMSRKDPRQRGLLGAAWALGYYSRFAMGGASVIVFGGMTGAHGLIHSRHDDPQPFYDESGGLFPVFHVVRALAKFSGRPARDVAVSHPDVFQAIAAEVDDHVELLVANLTPEQRTLTLPFDAGRVALIDADRFVAASKDPMYLDRFDASSGPNLTLSGYAVARILSA